MSQDFSFTAVYHNDNLSFPSSYHSYTASISVPFTVMSRHKFKREKYSSDRLQFFMTIVTVCRPFPFVTKMFGVMHILDMLSLSSAQSYHKP